MTSPPGTYNLGNVGTGELRVGNIAGQNITIKGLGTPANTIINQTVSGNRIFNYDNNQVGTVAGSISNVTLQGATNVNRAFGGGDDPSRRQAPAIRSRSRIASSRTTRPPTGRQA